MVANGVSESESLSATGVAGAAGTGADPGSLCSLEHAESTTASSAQPFARSGASDGRNAFVIRCTECVHKQDGWSR